MKQKLLIVDDEKGIVDMMKAYFSTKYEVLTAYNGQEALKKAEEIPDLILLDINMPGMNGLSVCETIRKYISCPILFLTARIETEDRISGFQVGADDYILKPFDLDELGARIAAHLRREQRRQGNSSVRFLGSLPLIMPPGRRQFMESRFYCPEGNLIFWSCFPYIQDRSLIGRGSMRVYGGLMGKAAATQ